MITETFGDLFRSKAHWEFEIFLMLLFDGLLSLGFWKFMLGKHWKHHLSRDAADKTYRRNHVN